MTKNRARILYIAYAAMIAAIYAVLTIVLQPISYGIMQIRVSEALSVLPYFTSSAIPGLFIGCLVANIIGGNGIVDVIVGSLATLGAAVAARFIKIKWLVPLPSVIINAVAVGAELYYILETQYSLPVVMLSVGAGQLIACYVIGIPLMLLLERFKRKLFPEGLR